MNILNASKIIFIVKTELHRILNLQSPPLGFSVIILLLLNRAIKRWWLWPPPPQRPPPLSTTPTPYLNVYTASQHKVPERKQRNTLRKLRHGTPNNIIQICSNKDNKGVPVHFIGHTCCPPRTAWTTFWTPATTTVSICLYTSEKCTRRGSPWHTMAGYVNGTWHPCKM